MRIEWIRKSTFGIIKRDVLPIENMANPRLKTQHQGTDKRVFNLFNTASDHANEPLILYYISTTSSSSCLNLNVFTA